MSFKKTLLILVSLFALIGYTQATHIRAGEITAERVDNLTNTFLFTFKGFRDTGSVIEFGSGTFSFGDGESQTSGFIISKTYIGNNIEMVQWQIIHAYPGAGTYIASYEEQYRNANIINMDNSVTTTFYVESQVVIDPFLGIDNLPVLTVPPIDFAIVGGEFIHNAGAYDPDGDSISYSFTIPKQSSTAVVNNYRSLIDSDFYSNYSQGNEDQNDVPSLTLDPRTGDLVWDAPGDDLNQGEFAEYNVAFVITEWRYIPLIDDWEPMGYVVRDMQIIVTESDNQRPELIMPEDVCVEAGQAVDVIVQGTDPDGDQVMIEAFGGPFEVQGNKATYTPDPAVFTDPPASTSFYWETECGHVRASPYQVEFKITDNPDEGPSLVNFETFEITVVGPAPEGLALQKELGREFTLSWDQYRCTNAETMQIWRRVGDFDIEVDDCEIGMPSYAGYTLIDEIDLYDDSNNPVTTYRDTNNGKGLPPGAKYCYRLVAAYPQPGGGESYVSMEVCDTVASDAPVITNVDIQSTSDSNGQIIVRWTPPYDLDQSLYPPAYTYDVLRAQGISGTSYTLVAAGISDTVITDSGINTLDYSYNYYVRLYDKNDFLVDSSATASSVKLSLKPLLASIQVTWTAEVPWSNVIQEYPYHYIYRDHAGSDASDLILIDSVDVTSSGFSYVDNGSFNGEELDDETDYCYYVITRGSYDNSPLIPEPLINRSQILCAQPNDTIPPCQPTTIVINEGMTCEQMIANYLCGITSYDQEISWTEDDDSSCTEDISLYNVYYSATGDEEDYELIGTSDELSYTHSNKTSLKGCYRITAMDRSGNESEPTESICMDNCPVYKLPNVFTPNGDGVNDYFTPLYPTGTNVSDFDQADCPRFISSVDLTIFDRSGNELYVYHSYENDNGIYINWDGTNKKGQKVPSGTYYYHAKVTTDVMNSDDAVMSLKGWVQIIR